MPETAIAAPMTVEERQAALARERVQFIQLNTEWNALFRKQAAVALALRQCGARIVQLEDADGGTP